MNKYTQHTPGPWSLEAVKDYLRHEDTGIDTEHPEAIANARLIAAAPDLLAELDLAERVIRHAVQESAGRVKAEIVGGWEFHAARIREAIAKAEGGAE